MSTVNIRILSIDDWKTYKSLRLNALKDSPDAFGSTFDSESGLPDYDWKVKLDVRNRENIAIPLIAEANGTPLGLAWGVVHEQEPNTAHIYQMWVKPEGRGNGIARQLLKYITIWAQDMELDYLKLSVANTNHKAKILYKSAGFVTTGEFFEPKINSSVKMQTMLLRLM